MYYMGSWILSDFNDPKVDKIGINNIGFFPVPSFENGKGNDLTFMEPGETICFSKKAYTPEVGDWLKAAFFNFGDQMLNVSGVISGFKISNPPANMQELSQTVLDVGKAATHPAVWFDVGFPAEASATASQNAGLFLSGQLSAHGFMEKVQAALDKARS
jgi:raffinose/stachyose/melibiose transport system substrate-binding protein